jgi:hypothetical protein
MYEVLWSDSARDQFQAILDGNPGLRTDLVFALRMLWRELHTDAAGFGESRAGLIRIVFVKPLIVWFEVDDGDRGFGDPEQPSETVLRVRLI